MEFRWICLLTLLPYGLVHAVVSGDPCIQAKIDLLSCEEEISALLRRRALSVYNTNITKAGFDSEDDNVFDATNDVMCIPSNRPSQISCILNNLINCTTLVSDTNLTSRPLGSYIASAWNGLNSTSQVCEGIQRIVCENKRTRFTGCYAAVKSNTATVDRNGICTLVNRGNVTCMMDAYNKCQNVRVNSTVPQSVIDLVVGDKWEIFQDSSQLCQCYTGFNCFQSLELSLNTMRDSIGDIKNVRDIYRQLFGVRTVICGTTTSGPAASAITCAINGLTSASPTSCKTAFKPYASSELRLKTFSTALTKACSVESISEEKLNCVLDKLTSDFHPCVADANIVSGTLYCEDVQIIYNCLKVALKGHCGLDDIVNIVYQTYRANRWDMPFCDVDSAATHRSPWISLILTCIGVIVGTIL